MIKKIIKSPVPWIFLTGLGLFLGTCKDKESSISVQDNVGFSETKKTNSPKYIVERVEPGSPSAVSVDLLFHPPRKKCSYSNFISGIDKHDADSSILGVALKVNEVIGFNRDYSTNGGFNQFSSSDLAYSLDVSSNGVLGAVQFPNHDWRTRVTFVDNSLEQFVDGRFWSRRFLGPNSKYFDIGVDQDELLRAFSSQPDYIDCEIAKSLVIEKISSLGWDRRDLPNFVVNASKERLSFDGSWSLPLYSVVMHYPESRRLDDYALKAEVLGFVPGGAIGSIDCRVSKMKIPLKPLDELVKHR